MEKLLDRAIRSSRFLSRNLKYVAIKAGAAVGGKGRPDWVFTGPAMKGFLMDLTTVAGRAAHYARDDGKRMLVLTYVR
jgi:hypothetical protein